MKNTDPDEPATFPEGFDFSIFATDEEADASLKAREHLIAVSENYAKKLENTYPQLKGLRKDEHSGVVWYEKKVLSEMGLI